MGKKKKASNTVRIPKKPFQTKNGFDYFVEFWDKYRTISRSSSV
jgi:hypothetical protein